MPGLPFKFVDKHGLTDLLLEKRSVETGDFLGDTTRPVRLLYGRRWITGTLIEQIIQDLGGGGFQTANFYEICEGEINSIKAYRVNGVQTTDSEETGVKVLGIYYRTGEVGVDDTETEAEYTADPTTQKRSQNFDYRTKTATAYSETAYAILLNKTDAIFELIGNSPRLEMDTEGLKINAYSSTGSVTSTAFDDNPAWVFADYCLSNKHGYGLTSSDIDFSVLKDSADFCSGAISSTEANAAVATGQNPASTQCIVGSTEGFVRGRAVQLAGTTDTTVTDIVSDTEITLDSAVVQTVGDTVVQRPPRFGISLFVDRVGRVDRFLKQILLACRGYVTHDAGKLQFRIEQADVAEILTDGGFENWTTATDLTDWAEVITGGTVNQDSTESRTGTYAVRMDRTDSVNNLFVQEQNVNLDPGRFYRLTVWAKTDTTQSEAVTFRIQNSTASEWLQTDGSWSGSAQMLVSGDSNLTYAEHSLTFRTKGSYGASDNYNIQIHATDASSGSSMYYDDATLRGPYSGHFKELSPDPGFGIRAGSFQWELPEPIRQINRVALVFENEGSDVGRDEVVVQDFTHQLNNPVKTLRVRAEAIPDRDQGNRIAQFILDKAQTLGPGARFSVEHGGLPIQPGDIILVDHAVPDWTAEELRVIRTKKKGLADPEDLFVELECEDYDESIYKDTSVTARGIAARPSGSLSLTVNSATSKRVDITASFDDPQMVVQRYFLHVGTAASFVPNINTIRTTSQSDRLIYIPRDSEVDTTVYFVVDAMTDRGLLRSAEVAQYISFVPSSDLQDTALQAASRFNLVKDGEFSTSGDGDTGWSMDTSATGTQFFPTSGAGDYTNPDDAADASDAEWASGGVTTIDPNDSQLWTFSDAGTLDVVLTSRHAMQSTGSSAEMQYSTNGGAGWVTLGTATSTTKSDSVTLTDQAMTDLQVRALATYSSSPGTHNVLQIHATAQAVATLSGSVLTLKSGGSAWRRFPLDITQSVTHLGPGSKVALTCSAIRENSGEALDDTVDIAISDDGETWTQVLHSIAAADVNDTWSKFGIAGVTVTDSVTSDQWRVRLTCNSDKGVQLDKLSIVRGEQVPLYEPNPIEMDGTGGTVGDFGTGDTMGSQSFQLTTKFGPLKETQ